MNNITIREYFPADSDDKDAFLTAFLDIWNNDENLKYLSFTMKPFSHDTIRIRIEGHKKQNIQYICAINQNNEIVGIATLRVNPIEGLEIYGIGVRLEFQKQGIGRGLLEQIISLATQLEYKAIEAVVFADNSLMLRLLLSFGFIPVSMDFHKRADGADIVQMKLFL